MITNINDFKLFLESIVKQKTDSEIFDYHHTIDDVWRPLIKNAQEFQHINFDLENDDSTGDKRKIYIKKNLRKDQPVKTEIAAELFIAGGDWENPVMYFRIEFISQYNLLLADYQKNPEYIWDVKTNTSNKKNVLIPPIEAGNKLVKYKDGFTAYTDDSIHELGLKDNDIRITDQDKKKAWKWLEDTLEKVVNDRWKMLDEDKSDNKPQKDIPLEKITDMSNDNNN